MIFPFYICRNEKNKKSIYKDLFLMSANGRYIEPRPRNNRRNGYLYIWQKQTEKQLQTK